MEEGKNIFLLDGPIGRKKLLIFLITVIVYSILFALLLSVIFGLVGVNIYTQMIAKILYVIYLVVFFYLLIINYSKRLSDITSCTTGKALLYVILCFVGLSAMEFIPILKYVGKLVGFVFFVCLLLVKGHLHGSADSDAEPQVVEENQNQA